jgi:hypothetical protein
MTRNFSSILNTGHKTYILALVLFQVGMYSMFLTVIDGKRTIANVGSRRLPSAAAWVRSQVKSCGIWGGQSGTGAGFAPSTSVSPANSHSTNIPYSSGLLRQANQWQMYQVDSVSPHPTELKKKTTDWKQWKEHCALCTGLHTVPSETVTPVISNKKNIINTLRCESCDTSKHYTGTQSTFWLENASILLTSVKDILYSPIYLRVFRILLAGIKRRAVR